MAAQALRGMVAQDVRHPAPGQRDADIGQSDRLGAEAALVILIADAEIEAAHALRMQRRHGVFSYKQPGREVRPSLAGMTDAQQEIGSAMSDAERGGNDTFVADQRRDDGIAFSNTLARHLAIESGVSIVVQNERRAELSHPLFLLDVHHVEELARALDIRGDLEPRATKTAEDAPAPRQLQALDRRLVVRIVVARQHEIAVERAGSGTAERYQRVRLGADIG